MSQTQEIIARIGADTSGFRRGVDDVSRQSAQLKNTMRVAFSQGEQSAKATAGAARSLGAEMGKAGQMVSRFGGLMNLLPPQAQQVVGAISSIFSASRGSPIALAFAGIAAAAGTVFRMMREDSDKARKHIEENFKAVAKLEAEIGGAKSTDPVERAKAKVAMGDIAGARGEMQQQREEAQMYAAYAPESDKSLSARRNRALGLIASNRADEIMMAIEEAEKLKAKPREPSSEQRERDAERNRRLVEAERALALKRTEASGGNVESMRLGFVRDDYLSARERKEASARAKDFAGEQESMIEMARLKAEAVAIRQTIDAKDRASDMVDARRDLTISRADAMGGNSYSARLGFMQQDYIAAKGRMDTAARAGNSEAAQKAMIEMVKLQADAIKIQQAIEKNTKGGARL